MSVTLGIRPEQLLTQDLIARSTTMTFAAVHHRIEKNIEGLDLQAVKDVCRQALDSIENSREPDGTNSFEVAVLMKNGTEVIGSAILRARRVA